MKYFNTLLAFCLICLHLTGCVIEAPQQEKDPDITPSECNLDPTLCSGSERCLLIDPCGSACGDDLDAPCPDVCIEIYACVSPLKPGDECDLAVDQCGDGFVCRPDWDAPCEPSFCDGYTCTADCREINTCQARQGVNAIQLTPLYVAAVKSADKPAHITTIPAAVTNHVWLSQKSPNQFSVASRACAKVSDVVDREFMRMLARRVSSAPLMKH